MTQQDRDLLLRDLSARSPYGVKVFIQDITGKYSTITERTCDTYVLQFLRNKNILIKPYLRPMSSMTEDERKEYNDIVKNTIDFYNCPKSEEICFFITPIDWLNAHHFDYRGLIEKGLALEAQKGMYEIVTTNI